MRPAIAAAILLFGLLAPPLWAQDDPTTAPAPDADAADAAPDAPPLTLTEADSRLDIALRMLQGGVYDRALDLANSILEHPGPPAAGPDAPRNDAWLQCREKARFIRERGRLGLAKNADDFDDVAEAFVQLSNNRYRLAEPAYHIQSAYWAARAYESTGDYRSAVDNYSRVGGLTLPPGMEGDAAQRMSRCLRLLAEEIPFPGGIRDRERRERLLNQAIAELDRARLAFPIGNRRKELELDLIALRMARREEQFVREAASEAEAYIASDPAKDELRARATLFRGQAAAMLGNPAEAADWFRKAADDEAPSAEDRRAAQFGLGLALVELSEAADIDEKSRLLRQADDALNLAIADSMSPGPGDNARIIKARVQLGLDQPSAALDTLRPILEGDRPSPSAWYAAGLAEERRGRLADALTRFYPSTLPSNPDRNLRRATLREAGAAADARRDFGLALALNHQASRMLRDDRLFSSLLAQEFAAMETILKLGRMGGPVSLSGDNDLLTADSDGVVLSIGRKRREAGGDLAAALARVLWTGGNPDSGYDLAMRAEAAHEWNGDSIAKLELAIAMISHLRVRQPAGVTDSVLSSRLGEARQALALVRAERILALPEPVESEIDRTLGDFAAAAASFQEASSGGLSVRDSLEQGMVNLDSGAFLMNLSERWATGKWAGRASAWREEARLRVEASLRPFNQAIATSAPASLAARRAKWSRGRALELMGEWRGALADYLSLMNNSELPRVLRVNAARRWAVCMGKLGENRAALSRLAVFAEVDAESALLAGHLAEEAGYPRVAYGYYLFAADPDAPSLPPATPGRVQDAAYHAARLALNDPNEANPLLPPEEVAAAARKLLETNALADPSGTWTVRMLNLLGESWLKAPGGAESAYAFAHDIINRPGTRRVAESAMRIVAAKALSLLGRYAEALDELDYARESLDDSDAARGDAALVTLETARVYRAQNRRDDALRAYANVFAVYPEQAEADDAARTEAATMLLSSPDAGSREHEQARNILSGLRDQVQAERIMRDYGIR